MSSIPHAPVVLRPRRLLAAAGLALLALLTAGTSALAVTLTDITSGALGDPSESRSFAWGDADGDGDLDLYIANTGANKLLENQGGTFVDITPVEIADASQSYAATWVDVDRDGDRDLYVSNIGGANKLFLNQGGMTFLESTPAVLADPLDTSTAVWADYDGDGDLDVYVVNVNGPNRLVRTDSSVLPGGSLQINGYVDVTPPVMSIAQVTRIAAWGDFDNDGDLDLHVGVDDGIAFDKIFENQGGSFVAHDLPAISRSFGVACGDYDEDGDLDLVAANYTLDLTIFRNDGGFNFTDVAPALGLTLNGTGAVAGAVAWVDWDNDGDLDLHVMNGINTADRLCENLGGGVFAAPVSSTIDPSGQDWSIGWVDLNDDGIREVYLSTVLVAGSAPNVLAQAASTGNHWFTVKTLSQPGTRVWLTAGGVTRMREFGDGDGAKDRAPADVVYFGLGSTTTIDSLVVRWPSGAVQRISSGLSVDSVLNLQAPESLDFTASDDTYENRVVLTWRGADGAGYLYKLFRRLPAEPAPGTLLSFLSSGDSTYTDPSGMAGVEYIYTLEKYSVPGGVHIVTESDAGRRIIFAPDYITASDGNFSDRIRVIWGDRSDIEAGYGVILPTFDPWGSGQVDLPVTAPASVEKHVLTDPVNLVFFAEKQDYVLNSLVFPAGLTLDAVNDGTFLGNAATPGVIPTGTVVNSFFLHGDHGLADSSIVYEATINFDARILGLEVSQPHLDGGDLIFGLPGTAYPNPGTGARGTDEKDSFFTLSPDRRSLTVSFNVKSSMDQVRIITQAGAGVLSLDANVSVFDDTSAPPDTDFDYSVFAFDDEGAVSDTVTVTGRRSRLLPPGNVQATDGTHPDRVRLTWSAPADSTSGNRDADESSYRIYRRDTPGIGVYSEIGSVQGLSTTTWDDLEGASLGSEREYSVTVRSADAQGVMLDESLVGIPEATDTGIGGDSTMVPILDVEASDDEYDDKVVVTWNDHPLEDVYIVFRDGVPQDTLAAGVTLFYDTTADPSVTYTYCVMAETEFGGRSPQVCDTGSRSPIIMVENLVASDGTREDAVDITWTSGSTTAALFYVYRDAVLIKTAPGTARSCPDESVDTEVHTYDVVGVTPYGTLAAPVSDTGYRRILAPTQVTASDNAFEDLVEVTWVDNSSVETGYRIIRWPVGMPGSPDTLDTVGRDSESYRDTQAVSRVAYTYGVQAVDDLGESAMGTENGRRSLFAPSGAIASQGKFEDRIDVEWKDNSKRELGYRIYRRLSGDLADSVLVGETVANARKFADTGMMVPIEFGETYEYSVVAFDADGISPSAQALGFTEVLPPSSVNASDDYIDRITVAWTDESSVETGYVIQIDGVPADTLPANASSYTDLVSTGLPEYCVIAISNDRSSEPRCDVGSRASSGGGMAADIELTAHGALVELVRPAVSRVGRAFVPEPYYTPDPNIAGDFSWDVGRINVFEYEGDQWVLSGRIDPPDSLIGANERATAPGDQYRFGNVVACNDNGTVLAVVSGCFPNATYFYIYEKTYNGWEGTFLSLTPNNTMVSNLVFDGDRLLVQFVDSTGQSPVTSFQVFEKGVDGWESTATLPPPSDGFLTSFGTSVDMDGDLIVVGRPGVINGDVAFVYERDGLGNWSEIAILNPPGNENGTRVAVDGNQVLVAGANFLSAYQRQAGGSFGTPVDTGLLSGLILTDPGFPEEFNARFELSLDDNLVLIGADINQVVVAGEWDGVTWKKTTVFGSGSPTYDAFGEYITHRGDFGIAAGIDRNVYFLDFPRHPDDLSASDGTNKEQVRLTWADRSLNESGFGVYRDGDLLATLSPGARFFEDTDAEPGRSYEYEVRAVASSGFARLAPPSDFGRIVPNGRIAGRVATPLGAGIPDVSVCLTPSLSTSLLLDGEAGGGYAATRSGPALPDEFTLDFWVKPTELGTQQVMVSKVAADSTVILEVRSSNYYSGGLYDGIEVERGGTLVYVPQYLVVGEWRHVEVSLAGGNLRVRTLDEDGVELHQGNWPGVFPAADPEPEGPWSLGARRLPPSSFLAAASILNLRGQLDEVRLWNRGLTVAEIDANLFLPLTGDENGLLAYWPLDQQTGVVSEELAGDRYLELFGGAYWAEESSPIDVCATTDEEGNYAISGIRYGTGAEIRVTPFKDPGEFEPEFKTITLNSGNPVWNEVEFTEVTAFTVSGAVVFAGGGCPVEGVEVKIDGNTAGTTDAEGLFSASVPPGTRVVSVSKEGLTFAQSSRDVVVSGDVSGVDFSVLTQRFATLALGGGCRGSDVGTFDILVQSVSGCYEETITGGTDIELTLPPEEYRFTVTDVSGAAPSIGKVALLKYFESLGPQTLDLSTGDGTVDLRYRAPLQIRVLDLPPYACGTLEYPGGIAAAPDGKIPQLSRQTLRLEVFAEYPDGSICYPDSGTVTIYDEVIDRAEPVTVELEGGWAEYETAGNTPNIFAGRLDTNGNDRSFQKAITLVAQADNRLAKSTKWVLVTGHRPRTSSFVATAEEIPILILRDPPGDHSYSYLSQGESFCTTITNTSLKGLTTSFSSQVKIGLEYNIGFILSTPVDITSSKINLNINSGEERTSSTDISICAEVTEKFSTSANEAFIGEDADVFLSAGVNFAFAQTDVIDLEGCRVVPSTSVAVAPRGFDSVLLFTRRHILEEEIPRLNFLAADSEAKGDGANAFIFRSAAENWQHQIDLADDLKDKAAFSRNRSFSAGADFEYTAVSDTSETNTYQLRAFSSDSKSLSAGFDIGGFKTSFTYGANLNFEYKQGTADKQSNRRTVGYVLADDDPGDFFSVDILEDRRYRTPVFDLKFGTSSCPWEAPTQKRDLPVLTISKDGPEVWPADEPAEFILNLSNGSESDEDRVYTILPDQVSNPDGAILKVNGVTLGNSGVEFRVPRFDEDNNLGTTRATLTVERGPSKYTYNDLKIRMIPPCEAAAMSAGYAVGEDMYVDVPFSVKFDGPCSDVDIYLPTEGWVFSAADDVAEGGKLEILLTDFDLDPQENKEVTEIGAEFRRVGTSTWESAGFMTRKDILETSPRGAGGDPIEVSVLWDVSALPDGEYEIRGFTRCRSKDGTGTSLPFRTPPVRGVIDRIAPALVADGLNPPMADVLSLGEAITASFDESIDCAGIVTGCDPEDLECVPNVVLYRDPLGVNEVMGVDVLCEDGVLTVIPQNQKALRGQTVRVRLNGIPDLAGNLSDDPADPGDDILWDFTVTQDQFAWTKSSATLSAGLGTAGAYTAVLVNGSSLSIPYTVSLDLTGAVGLVGEIGITPTSGLLGPGKSQEFQIVVSGNVLPGTYPVVVEAVGDGPVTSDLALTVDIACNAPDWAVNPADFEHTMTLVGRMRIEGVPDDDPADMIAAFVGDEIRGVAHATPDSLVFLTIYGNNQSGERVRFRIWDDSECKLYTYAAVNDPGTVESTDAIFFGTNTTLGHVADPVIIDARQPVAIATTEIPVAAGWTWISLNRTTALGLTTSLVLGDLNLTEGDLIKTLGTTGNPNPFAVFSPICGWGCNPEGLDTLDVVHGYMVNLAEAGTISLEGNPVDPMDPANAILVNQGWNMIGYPGTTPASVSAAFGNLAAPFEPGDGDLVKSQYAFAQFDAGQDAWFGDLEDGLMQPGQGYLLYSSVVDSFHYGSDIAAPGPGIMLASFAPGDGGDGRPDRSALRRGVPRTISQRAGSMVVAAAVMPGVRLASEPGWSFDPGEFQYTMTLTGSLDLGELKPSEEQVVAALVGGEVRGWAHPRMVNGLNDYRLFMMIYSNRAKGEEVEFRLYDAASDETLPMRETLEFEVDEIVGLVGSPFELSTDGTRIGDGTIVSPALRGIQPNPSLASQGVEISFELSEPTQVGLELFDIQGRRVAVVLDERFPEGRHLVTFRKPDLASGLYLLRFRAGAMMETRKITLLR